MILSDAQIRKALAERHITIDPFDDHDVKSSSYDFHLSQHFRIFDGQHALAIDPLKDQRDLWKTFSARPGQKFILRPGTFALASSVERFTFDDTMVGLLEGKSSVARFGLIIEAAGWFDPGFEGWATLELFNPTSLPIILYPGMVIGHMTFMPVLGPVVAPYGTKQGGRDSKYQHQGGGAMPEPSHYYENYPDGEVPFPMVWLDRSIQDFEDAAGVNGGPGAAEQAEHYRESAGLCAARNPHEATMQCQRPLGHSGKHQWQDENEFTLRGTTWE